MDRATTLEGRLTVRSIGDALPGRGSIGFSASIRNEAGEVVAAVYGDTREEAIANATVLAEAWNRSAGETAVSCDGCGSTARVLAVLDTDVGCGRELCAPCARDEGPPPSAR